MYTYFNNNNKIRRPQIIISVYVMLVNINNK